ncbi:MAG: PstS family phosphate ABC transporter substrate-binding protein [Bacteroidales bacterium]|nr:PstS family phosphate ABC transporter substrate-binding protein [Bacteroidales bacterium]
MKTMLKLSFLLMVVSLAFTSCKKDEKTIKIDGSSTVFPITEAVAEEFRSEMSNVRVTIGISGTGGGFKKFGRGETDISDASRPIKQKEIDICKENSISYVDLTVAFDGLAVIVNPENTWVDYFTVEELKKIWEPAAEGKIVKWNQIRPEWPDQELQLFGPGVASGTFDYFTEAVVGESGSSRGDFTASEDDNVLVQGVATSKYGLGFFGLAYYEENANKLKLVAVDGGEGPVKPSIETVSNGTYSPLSRPLFIYLNSKAAKREEVKKFVSFYLKNAPKLSKEVGYVPLPAEEYAVQTKKFEDFLKSL